MGIVLGFPEHYSCSSDFAAKPKIAGSGRIPLDPSGSSRTKKYSAGILPRALQWETAGGLTPASRATQNVPPRASINSSTDEAVLSTECKYLQNVKLSSQNKMEIEDSSEMTIIHGMIVNVVDIKKRLEKTRRALGLQPIQISQEIGISRSQWTHYITIDQDPIRNIPIEKAISLCDRYRLTLDWIYRGDPSGLPQQLFDKIKRLDEGLIKETKKEPVKSPKKKSAVHNPSLDALLRDQPQEIRDQAVKVIQALRKAG